MHGRAGSWKDPYSSKDNTARQRQYNRALRGTAGVYTPQAVINGRSETVGNRANDVAELLAAEAYKTARIEITPNRDGLTVQVAAFDAAFPRDAEIVRLTLLPQQTTSVPRGENHGAVLSSRNVVLAAEPVGTYAGGQTSISIAAPQAGESCAVIIQEKQNGRLGPILGASYC